MLDALEYALGLGLEAHALSALQMVLRALLVFLVVLALTRLGDKRVLGKATPFDFILAILLGSIASRAITGNAPFFPTLAAVAALVALHWFFAWCSYRFSLIGRFIKGRPREVVRDGKLVREGMRKSHLSEHDVMEALRTQAQTDDLSAIRAARLERSGEVSVIRREREARIVDVAVEAGVKTVRIELA